MRQKSPEPQSEFERRQLIQSKIRKRESFERRMRAELTDEQLRRLDSFLNGR